MLYSFSLQLLTAKRRLMSYYCQNCGALNSRDRVRCSACFQSLEHAKSSPPKREPPWSQKPRKTSENATSSKSLSPVTGGRREQSSNVSGLMPQKSSEPRSTTSSSSSEVPSAAERLWSLRPDATPSQNPPLPPISLDSDTPRELSSPSISLHNSAALHTH